MNKNLIKILKSFSAEEWESFEDFSASPFFAKSRDYTPYVRFLKSRLNGKPGNEEFNPGNVNKFIGKNFSAQTINNRLSELSKLAERFLSVRNFEKNQTAKFAGLYEELTNRNLFDVFHSSYKSNESSLVPKDPEDFIPYLKVLKAAGFYHRNRSAFDKMLKYFSRHAEYFSAYALFKFVYFYTEFSLLEKWNTKYKADEFNALLKSVDFEKIALKLEKNGKDIYKPFVLRFLILKAVTNSGNKNLAANVIRYFNENKNTFTIDSKIDFFISMQSIYNSLINNGDDNAFEDLHELHKEKLADGDTINFSLLNNSASEFRDFVIAGLSAGDYKWVENFIEVYSPGLHPSIREDEVLMSKVRLCLEKNDLLVAIHLLRKRKNSGNHLYNIDAYLFKITVYFELKMYEELEREIDKLRHYINNNDLIPQLANGVKVFIDKLLLLVKISNAPSEELKNEFRKDLKKNVNSVFMKKWFLKMTDKIN